MSPPKWAKEFMRFKWAGDAFNDDTIETEVYIGDPYVFVEREYSLPPPPP
jgi:hypothetical protein